MTNDKAMTYAELLTELSINTRGIAVRNRKRKTRDICNTIFILSGVLVIPIFLINLKCAYELEIQALKSRNRVLKSYLVKTVRDRGGK